MGINIKDNSRMEIQQVMAHSNIKMVIYSLEKYYVRNLLKDLCSMLKWMRLIMANLIEAYKKAKVFIILVMEIYMMGNG
jgi:hypothetical protein